MRLCEIWKEQCDAARQIEAEFGTEKALARFTYGLLARIIL